MADVQGETKRLHFFPGKWIVIIGVLFSFAFVVLSLRMFYLFHTIPSQESARRVLRESDFIEVFTLEGGIRSRQLDVQTKPELELLAEGLVFRDQRWQRSIDPADGDVVLLVHARGDRDSMMCLKNDAHLHLKKGSMWYRMPIEETFEKSLRERIATEGQEPMTVEELKAAKEAAEKKR